MEDGSVRLSPILTRDKSIVAGSDGSLSLAAMPEGGAASGADRFRCVPVSGGVRIESVAQPGMAIAATAATPSLQRVGDPRCIWATD